MLPWPLTLEADPMPIQVYSPSPQERVGRIVSVRGRAQVFEGTVFLRIRDCSGQNLGETWTTAKAGGPQWGDFSVSVKIEGDPLTEDGWLELFSPSEENGSELDFTQISIRFAFHTSTTI